MSMHRSDRGNETLWSLVFAVLGGGALLLQSWQALHWGQNSWPMTEWLINYSGGFVRRGLPGEILLRMASATHLSIQLLAVAVSLLSLAALLACLLRAARGRVPLPLLFSGLLLGSMAYTGNAIRKDTLMVLGLCICLKLLTPGKNSGWRLAALQAVVIAVLLSHEAFFFLAVPALFLMLGWQKTENSRPMGWKALPAIAPALLVMAGVMHFHGDAAIAHNIDRSLLPAWRAAAPESCCSAEPQAAIDSLGWTSRESMSLSAASLRHVASGIWEPLAWALLILVTWFLLTAWLREGEDPAPGEARPRARFTAILLLQFVGIAPLYIVGRDFGRWIFLWAASSLVLYLGGFAPQCQLFRQLLKAGAWLTPETLFAHIRPGYWVLLFLGLPTCCWTIPLAVHACPAGYYLRAVLIATHHMNPPY